MLLQPDTAIADADRMEDILADGLHRLRDTLAAERELRWYRNQVR